MNPSEAKLLKRLVPTVALGLGCTFLILDAYVRSPYMKKQKEHEVNLVIKELKKKYPKF